MIKCILPNISIWSTFQLYFVFKHLNIIFFVDRRMLLSDNIHSIICIYFVLINCRSIFEQIVSISCHKCHISLFFFLIILRNLLRYFHWLCVCVRVCVCVCLYCVLHSIVFAMIPVCCVS